ncbi:ABC transporter ATP-binding protein [Paraclostridium bifermentans]|uniref:ABC transporter ATP-binding protein n=1 Tax=Paraclostridium bifermentans TaxID=1490 RepID=UPI001C118BC3|nr:ABC transporter ATP-binding protein [Paraclostridium bifermentans]MBS5955163.1 ABC transporter ATP-binding protein [Paraclostridium bifermentans]MBU5289697.1 ABC transporter ATP-binding protein [Paraclostridium bifermentans]
MKNILQVKNLNRSIDNNLILDNVTFNIPKGKIIGFVGPNGAGKTTTLKILSGLANYDSGEIIFNDKNIDCAKKGEIIFIQDNPLIYEELTGSEYLKFIADLFNIQFDKNEINELISDLDFTDFVDKEIRSYSLGMKKKIALIGVLIIHPKLLLLDEFLSGIDPVNLYSIKKTLRNFTSCTNSIFISTHQLELAEKFCDIIISIDKGQIIDKSIDMNKIIKDNSSLEDYFITNFKER